MPTARKATSLMIELGRDRQHQAVLTLGSVDVPGAKQRGKCGHQHRDEKRDVADERLRHAAAGRGVGENGADRGRNRLKLKCDVGDHADDRDQRDRRRDGLALAVTRGDEIRDRRDVLPLGEADDADHQRIRKADHQHRADIDREKIKSGARSDPDRAEKRPRGAIDGERQWIDQQAGAVAANELMPAIAIARDQEQKPDIGEGDDDDDPALQHGASCLRPPGLGFAAVCCREAGRF